MDTNFENLKREELRLTEFVRKSTWRCWIWVLAVAMVAIFISMYFIIIQFKTINKLKSY